MPGLDADGRTDVLVTSWSTIRVLHNAYSVPSRLIGERVRVRVHERHLEVYYGGDKQLEVERLLKRWAGLLRERFDALHAIQVETK